MVYSPSGCFVVVAAAPCPIDQTSRVERPKRTSELDERELPEAYPRAV
jgi:hypothetical protein